MITEAEIKKIEEELSELYKKYNKISDEVLKLKIEEDKITIIQLSKGKDSSVIGYVNSVVVLFANPPELSLSQVCAYKNDLIERTSKNDKKYYKCFKYFSFDTYKKLKERYNALNKLLDEYGNEKFNCEQKLREYKNKYAEQFLKIKIGMEWKKVEELSNIMKPEEFKNFLIKKLGEPKEKNEVNCAWEIKSLFDIKIATSYRFNTNPFESEEEYNVFFSAK